MVTQRDFLNQKSTIGTIAAIAVNNGMYCLQKWIEKFPLYFSIFYSHCYLTSVV